MRSLTTTWSGAFVFDGGKFMDPPVRTETLEMELSRSCLNDSGLGQLLQLPERVRSG